MIVGNEKFAKETAKQADYDKIEIDNHYINHAGPALLEEVRKPQFVHDWENKQQDSANAVDIEQRSIFSNLRAELEKQKYIQRDTECTEEKKAMLAELDKRYKIDQQTQLDEIK